ncbi:hypothetical protein PTKIN_Ptkin16aG0093300 [Pterospermum kingtungense]
MRKWRQNKILNFFQRLNMAIDIGCALEYLHHHCETPIVHCDLKPSNILLNDEMVGHVGDFGLAEFINLGIQNNTSSLSRSLGFKGTIGYIPPGKRPTDEMFKENLNLHDFVKTALPNRVAEITDPTLLQESFSGRTMINNTFDERSHKDNRLLWGLNSIFEVRVASFLELPTERTNMVEVIAQLCSIKEKPFPIRSARTRGINSEP